MYISIDKKWLKDNYAKFEEQSDDDESIVISDEDISMQEPELGDGIDSDGSFYINQQSTDKKLWISIDYKHGANEVAEIVEKSMDDLKGEALTKVIEVVVKKLNKLRSFIESIKGL